jgi:predicted small lipoprotein YifL
MSVLNWKKPRHRLPLDHGKIKSQGTFRRLKFFCPSSSNEKGRNMSKIFKATLLTAAAFSLAACGGRGDDTMGDNVAQAYENQADTLDNQAEQADMMNNDTAEAMLENQADALRDEGQRKEEAIDNADVNAAGMNASDAASMVNAM